MIAWRFEQGRRVLPWLAAVLFACSAYEPALLDPKGRNVAGRGGNDGGGNDVGGDDGAGKGGAGNTGAGRGGAGNTAAGNGGSGGESSPGACGDGRVAASEKCDTAIDQGPGACPTECPPIGECVTRMLNGSNCQAECLVLAETCTNNDGCCPQTCSAANDDDCPDHCGDGTVQEDEGETCEPTGGAGSRCPALADCDDGMPCTTDSLMGSAANCNASCAHTPSSTLRAGDQCCPAGANANTDSDCLPECGNQIAEPGEDCDGGASCDADCKLIPTAMQQDCLDRFVHTGTPEATCERCACFTCTQEMFDCRGDTDATRRMRCDVLVTCGLEEDCVGQACYCGSADLATCAGSPSGPCIPEVQQAAGPSMSAFEILQRQTDPNYALGRANLLGICAAQKCPDVCP